MKTKKTIQEFLHFFNVEDYYETDDKIISSCPIHDGDNKTAFNINIDEESDYYGCWFCNTKACHEKYGNGILHLIRCLMETNSGEDSGFVKTLQFVEGFVSNMNIEVSVKEMCTFDNLSKELIKRNNLFKSKTEFSKKSVRSRLSIPADFYIRRGFCPKVLDEFDIGLCKQAGSEMYNRVVFPVYDVNDEFMVGCSGRTVVDHPQKWKNKKGFNTANYLYNYGKSLEHIKKSSAIILVEGQGDVIKLWQAGVYNAVGIFGSYLSDAQEFLIQKTGALKIITIFDNDDAGQKCREDVFKKMRINCEIEHLMVPSSFNDIGEMSSEQINNHFNIGE